MKKTIKGIASIFLLSAFLVACAEEGDTEQPPPAPDPAGEEQIENTPPGGDMETDDGL